MRYGVLLAMAGVAGLAACGTGRSVMERADLVSTPTACHAQRFDVYFGEGEARLTDSARQAVGMTATLLQGCEIRRVQVVGLADATGGSAANLTLSQRRAQAVAEALTAAGWPSPVFDLDAAGDRGAVTAGGLTEPLRRRTEVIVTAAPR